MSVWYGCAWVLGGLMFPARVGKRDGRDSDFELVVTFLSYMITHLMSAVEPLRTSCATLSRGTKPRSFMARQACKHQTFPYVNRGFLVNVVYYKSKPPQRERYWHDVVGHYKENPIPTQATHPTPP